MVTSEILLFLRERESDDGSSRNRLRSGSTRTLSLPLRFRHFQKTLPHSHRSLQVARFRSNSVLISCNTSIISCKLVIQTSLTLSMLLFWFALFFTLQCCKLGFLSWWLLLWMQHTAVAYKFDCAVWNMEGGFASQHNSLVAFWNTHFLICCFSRSPQAFLLENI